MKRTVPLLLLFFVSLCGLALSQNRARTRRQRPSWPTLEIGSEAPALTLPLLKAQEDREGKRCFSITDETVDIGSFRGRKVVCLFLSSYT